MKLKNNIATLIAVFFSCPKIIDKIVNLRLLLLYDLKIRSECYTIMPKNKFSF